MSNEISSSSETSWLSVPEVAELLGVSLSRVRTLIAEQFITASRRNGPLQVPGIFFLDGEPIPSLRGTLVALSDAGFDDDESIDWLLAFDEEVGDAPVEALRQGRKSIVRRTARALA